MKLTKSKTTGLLGANHVERIVLAADAKPIFIPEDRDTGIDGFIEFSVEYGPTKLVAFQVKCGSSYFDKTGPVHNSDTEHLGLWGGYPLPVVLIIIADDGSSAYWMDARKHVRDNPDILDKGPYVLRPPRNQIFNTPGLRSIRELAKTVEFGDAVEALSHSAPARRNEACGLLSTFKCERRTVFCVAAALKTETEPSNLRILCDFYSRYLSHPEASFGCSEELSRYARECLGLFSNERILDLLDAFNDEDVFGDWSGATEIFSMNDEEVWPPTEMIPRGTVQQGMAVIIKAVARPQQLFAIISDDEALVLQRIAAIALFGYLGYRCDPEQVKSLADKVVERTLRALLVWLWYWMKDHEEMQDC